MKQWNRAAMQFSACRYLPQQGMLDVSFRNGDRFQVPIEALVQSPLPSSSWERLRIGETQDVLELPGRDSITEIPWDRIRCVADPEFRAHLADQAAHSARRIGQRLRELRQESGLTQEAIARATGIARVTISRLEKGLVQPTFEMLTRLLAALGKQPRDLALDQDPADAKEER